MANDLWFPTSAELRRQLNTKMLETERDYWMTTNEMLHGMIDAIWDAAKAGEPITIGRNGERFTLRAQDQR